MSASEDYRREIPTRETAEECSPAEGIECLLAATRELSAATDLEQGLRSVADELQRFVQYDTFAVLLLDDLGRELHFVYARGFPPEVQEHWRFGLGQGIVGTVAQTQQPLLVEDVDEEERYIHATDLVRSELALPLTTRRRTIGVLDLGSSRKSHFSRAHLRVLSSLADHLASAIENSQLYQNLREQAQTLSLLHEMSRELASILDRQKLLERVAELLKPLINFDLFTILLWNPEHRLLEPWTSIFSHGLGELQARAMRLGEGICGTAAALRQSIRVANVELDPRYESCFKDLDIRSELAVPLIFEDRLIGVIDLESSSYDAFSSRHEQLLSTVASSLAIALENARLYEELSESEARFEGDLMAAREIQKQLLPKRTPWLPGVQIAVMYEAARHLAGDFYDFLPCGDNCVALAVADVAGKSTSAALYGSLAAGMLREYLDQNPPDPCKVLADLNCKLHQLAIDNRFLALAFAVYDGDRRAVTLANSGLPHPYLLRGRSLQRLVVEGVPLGLLPDRSYQSLRIDLAPGDALVFSSDGIEESLDAEDREFGRERVEDTLRRLAHLPAEQLARGLVEAASRFSASDAASDDRTVVVLKLAGN